MKYTFMNQVRNRIWSITLTMGFIAALIVAGIVGADKADADTDCANYKSTDAIFPTVSIGAALPGERQWQDMVMRVTVHYRYCIDIQYVGGIPRTTDWVKPLRVVGSWKTDDGSIIKCHKPIMGFNGVKFDPYIFSNEKSMLGGDTKIVVNCQGDYDEGNSEEMILWDAPRFYPPGWPEWNSTCRINYNNHEDEDCLHHNGGGGSSKLHNSLSPIV